MKSKVRESKFDKLLQSNFGTDERNLYRAKNHQNMK